jgi:hypothetical protein
MYNSGVQLSNFTVNQNCGKPASTGTSTVGTGQMTPQQAAREFAPEIAAEEYLFGDGDTMVIIVALVFILFMCFILLIVYLAYEE